MSEVAWGPHLGDHAVSTALARPCQHLCVPDVFQGRRLEHSDTRFQTGLAEHKGALHGRQTGTKRRNFGPWVPVPAAGQNLPCTWWEPYISGAGEHPVKKRIT